MKSCKSSRYQLWRFQQLSCERFWVDFTLVVKVELISTWRELNCCERPGLNSRILSGEIVFKSWMSTRVDFFSTQLRVDKFCLFCRAFFPLCSQPRCEHTWRLDWVDFNLRAGCVHTRVDFAGSFYPVEIIHRSIDQTHSQLKKSTHLYFTIGGSKSTGKIYPSVTRPITQIFYICIKY